MICLEDVNYALENGKVKGIENIIQKKFAELGVHKRPLHCTDVKRGTLYVKGDEGWEKEKGEMNKMIRDVECVQTTGIKVWSEANPEYSKGSRKLMDKWLRIVQCLTNSIDGIGMTQNREALSRDEQNKSRRNRLTPYITLSILYNYKEYSIISHMSRECSKKTHLDKEGIKEQ